MDVFPAAVRDFQQHFLGGGIDPGGRRAMRAGARDRRRTVEGVEIELVEGVEAEGRFVDADRGEPVVPVQWSADSPRTDLFPGSQLAGARVTDTRGSFRFQFNPGEVEMVAFSFPPGYAKTYPRGFRQTVEIPAASAPSPCRHCGPAHPTGRGNRPGDKAVIDS